MIFPAPEVPEPAIPDQNTMVRTCPMRNHKSLGSEYPAAVIPVLMEQCMMLQRNLLNTAVTLLKKLVVIVGQKEGGDSGEPCIKTTPLV